MGFHKGDILKYSEQHLEYLYPIQCEDKSTLSKRTFKVLYARGNIIKVKTPKGAIFSAQKACFVKE